MYYIYILKSLKNSRFYTGSTQSLQKRLDEHNSGKSKATRFNRPFELVYYETAETRAEALSRERYFKTGKGRDEIKAKLAGH